jgi:hypothetical protein
MRLTAAVIDERAMAACAAEYPAIIRNLPRGEAASSPAFSLRHRWPWLLAR